MNIVKRKLTLDVKFRLEALMGFSFSAPMQIVQKEAIKELKRILNNRVPLRIRKKNNITPAAVMLILREEDAGYSMLFIKRPENRRDAFSGHMAFPGGKVKSIDKNKVETAIRETLEETGIDLNKSGGILGELDDFHPNNPRASHYAVTPCLSILRGHVGLNLDTSEVAEAIWIPISHLKEIKNQEIRIKERSGRLIEDFVYYYRDYVIWGMTGRILSQFLRLFGHLF